MTRNLLAWLGARVRCFSSIYIRVHPRLVLVVVVVRRRGLSLSAACTIPYVSHIVEQKSSYLLPYLPDCVPVKNINRRCLGSPDLPSHKRQNISATLKPHTRIFLSRHELSADINRLFSLCSLPHLRFAVERRRKRSRFRCCNFEDINRFFFYSKKKINLFQNKEF